MRSSLIVCVALWGVVSGGCRKDSVVTGPGSGVPGPPPTQGGGEHAEGVPPISGGTLLVTQDDTLAFASDPDRDRVVIVNLAQRKVAREIVLDADSDPGRAIEDAAGNVHVVLRGKAGILSLDREGGELSRRAVCAAPRGIAYDADQDQLVVACLGGELVRMGAPADGSVVRTVRLASDLRDVVIKDGTIYVSVFRSSRVLILDQADELMYEGGPGPSLAMTPTVAWRMTEWPGMGVFVSHQRSSTGEILVGEEAPPNGYGDGEAPPIVENGGSTVDEFGDIVETASDPSATLPVDADVNETGTEVAVVSASSDRLTIFRPPLGFERFDVDIPGEPIAVHFANDDQDVIVQTREPSTLVVVALDFSIDEIDLGGEEVFDVGHAIFHRTLDGPTTFGVSCASCHPEGREDGHVWNFSPLGARRTQSLLGGIASTKPFHWDGDQRDMSALLDEVFVFRMGNHELNANEVDAFSDWLDTLDDLPTEEVAASELGAGRAAFAKAGCDSCHSGERLTSGGAADVGTGGTFQIPSLLGARYRGPYLHDGCAPTLADRFGSCGGGDLHGDVSKLSDDELQTLIAHLERL